MSDWTVLLLYAGVLLGVAIVMILGTFAARRWRQRLLDSQQTPPFTLQDLRDMKASGQITEEEFRAMRAALLGAWSAPGAPQPPDESGPA
jgi:uncharacterized protein YneF (UPF0154 family)